MSDLQGKKPAQKQRRTINPRRSFSVKSQIVGKLGEDGYDLLRAGLDKAAS